MPRAVILGEKTQAWKDKDDVWHAVAFNSEPHRLLCKPVAMWGYTPKLALIEDISCPECRKEMDSGI